MTTQRPEANGATVTTGGYGECYAEFGMKDRNSNENWESAFLDASKDGEATETTTTT